LRRFYPIMIVSSNRSSESFVSSMPGGCSNQVVRFLADCVRIHPLPREDRPVADRLMPLARSLLEAWYDEPYYLGQLFSEKKCAIDEMGQVMIEEATRR